MVCGGGGGGEGAQRNIEVQYPRIPGNIVVAFSPRGKKEKYLGKQRYDNFTLP
jgi:hypothetical protein